MLKLENQVCSLELAKKLKEFGFEQDSCFYWDEGDGVENRLEFSPNKPLLELLSAYTVAELGEMLMLHKERNEENNIISIVFENSQCLDEDCDCGGTKNFNAVMMISNQRKYVEMDYPSPTYSPSEANVRAKMLIYLKENNLLL